MTARDAGAAWRVIGGIGTISRHAAAIVAAVLAAVLAGPASAAAADTAHAGVAVADASWHLGASAGQFSADEPPITAESVDPYHHSTKKRPSYGLGSRVTVRALVVEDAGGERVAIVSHDLYLPQDLLTRRIAALVEQRTGIRADHVLVTASHNHNSAFYSTPGWGTWIFQDVFDLRFYEYMAQRSAEAVERAASELVPVRMGGATSTFNEITSHTYGPKVADDGTPAGQPWSHTTGNLSVVAFDEISDPERPRPFATWVIFGVHPEWTWGYDLLNGDIGHATMRILDRETGGTTVWSGREIGTSGPHKDTRVHPPEARREYQDNGFAQIDRAARLLADAVHETRAAIAAEEPEQPDRYAAYDDEFDLAVASERFAPPTTRPYPGVSNCNTAALFHGDPRLPILGLPDCESAPTGPLGEAIAPIGSQLYEQLKAAGVPIPESYSPTKLTAVEETAAVHLMAIKLGSIGITVCPCELFTDTALNIESRIDRTEKNLWLGWNWVDQTTPAGRDWCVQNADTSWTCADPRSPTEDLEPVSDLALRRAVAQIENDARGWEDELATLGSEAEPADPAKIKGNFTHEEFPRHGFALPIAVGMGNDYWGYMPEYREYRAHDHYRKALSGLGPHGADFLATRLSRMAASLNGGPGPNLRPLDLVYQAESARAQAMAQTLGELAAAYEDVYERTLPADGGVPAIAAQPGQAAEPADILAPASPAEPRRLQLFSAAHVSWIGGSTYAEMPDVRVERRVDGAWVPYGDTDGDVELTVRFPRPEELPAWRAGAFEWRWTAAFEAFGSDTVLPDATGEPREQTPFGTYRFVIAGERRTGVPAATQPYELTSEPFEVVPWTGVTARELRIEPDGTVSFAIGPVTTHRYPGGKVEVLEPIDLPDSYESPFRLIDPERRVFTYGLGDPSRHQVYCSFCSFRPWADTSDVASATVTFARPGGPPVEVSATLDPASGRWRTAEPLRPKQRAWVEVGGVVDTFGNFNGERSEVVERVP